MVRQMVVLRERREGDEKMQAASGWGQWKGGERETKRKRKGREATHVLEVFKITCMGQFFWAPSGQSSCFVWLCPDLGPCPQHGF